MIVDLVLELLLLGARMANPELRATIPNDLFTGDLAEFITAENGDQVRKLWEWLAVQGVVREGAEKPLEAIIRCLTTREERRAIARELIAEIDKLTAAEIGSVTRLRELRDKVRGLRPVPERGPPVPPEGDL